MDGLGVAPAGEANAVSSALMTNFTNLMNSNPNTTLGAAGPDVGLPKNQMGNSEVGHLNIGAGRIVYQDLTRIDSAIEDGSFFTNPTLNEAIDRAKSSGGALHLMGLLSDGGVHSTNTHLYALLESAKRGGLENVFIHCFLDGRDTAPRSALKYLADLDEQISVTGLGRIATVCGRYYAMDRDHRWERVKSAYDLLVYGQGHTAQSAAAAVEESYARGQGDEFVEPTAITAPNGGGQVTSGDSVIFFNFRSDRARELVESLTADTFTDFDRGPDPPDIFLVCMTEYDQKLALPLAFGPEKLENILAQVVADHGLRQLHIAETEKYAHVTFFFNGGVEEPVAGEDRILVPSPKVATYDLKPEMSAEQVTDEVVEAVEAGKYDLVVVNLANPDMVGHTGVIGAAKRALETVDMVLGRIVSAVRSAGGVTIITADHGNAERMTEEDGLPWTAHTTSRVPFIYVGGGSVELSPGARLADIAPTVLGIMGLPVPAEMTGSNLIKSRENTGQSQG